MAIHFMQKLLRYDARSDESIVAPDIDSGYGSVKAIHLVPTRSLPIGTTMYCLLFTM